MTNLWNFLVNSREEIAKQTIQHLGLTLASLSIAIVIGVVVGIILTRYKQIANKVISIAGVIQTIPSVALLGFMLPILGIGLTPAIVALFLYALLPIIRNTFIGIEEVDSSIKEAAKGMGMPSSQILLKVELPLATPVIFAGIRTAAVTNVGVATLCALIASGGLGQFIFQGIALNNTDMILAGAIPSAGLAILLDFILGVLQKNVTKLIKPILITGLVLLSASLLWAVTINNKPVLQVGFDLEFMGRADGYPGLSKHYDLDFDNTRQLDPALMYQALKEKQVDVISGFATDGRIKAYDIQVLADDKNFFPPYYAAPLVRGETLRKYPQLTEVLGKLTNQISDQTMAELNYLVDEKKQPTNQVARDFLQKLGLKTSTQRSGSSDLVIASKNFTEQYILAEMLGIVIENYTNLDVDLKPGLGGTQIAFNALFKGDIDIYPEYTGTGLLTILQPQPEIRDQIINDTDQVYTYVKEESKKQYDLDWLSPFGFNNTYALMMRKEDTTALDISSISDLKDYLDNISN